MRLVNCINGPNAGGLLNDLYRFNATTAMWTPLSPNGTAPSPRYFFGFTSTSGGLLYVFGGDNGNKDTGLFNEASGIDRLEFAWTRKG